MHGVPIEREAQRQLSLADKAAIEGYGLIRFNRAIKRISNAYIKEWEDFTSRMGFWIDLAAPYKTDSRQYIQGVWWIIRHAWERSLLYQGTAPVPFCHRCGTGLSPQAVESGRRIVAVEQVVAILQLEAVENTYLMVDCRSAGYLAAAEAFGVFSDARYATVQQGADRLVCEDTYLERLKGGFAVISMTPGVKPVREIAAAVGRSRYPLRAVGPNGPKPIVVLPRSFERGSGFTGIVPLAPALNRRHLDVLSRLRVEFSPMFGDNGRFVDGPFRHSPIDDADIAGMAWLRRSERLFSKASAMDTRTVCWRCGTPLINQPKQCWFLKTSRVRTRALSSARSIKWRPAGTSGRVQLVKSLGSSADWNLSRERFWSTPLPVWQCGDCKEVVAVGSVEELQKRLHPSSAPVPGDLHKPFIDRVVLSCPACRSAMRRAAEVMDVWLDSGAMPFAQWNTPSDRRTPFDGVTENYPADLVIEGEDQITGWFHALVAVAATLDRSVPFKNALPIGLVVDACGEKMSKSKGNTVDTKELLARYGADALRWYFYVSGPSSARKHFSEMEMATVSTSFLDPILTALRGASRRAGEGRSPASESSP